MCLYLVQQLEPQADFPYGISTPMSSWPMGATERGLISPLVPMKEATSFILQVKVGHVHTSGSISFAQENGIL